MARALYMMKLLYKCVVSIATDQCHTVVRWVFHPLYALLHINHEINKLAHGVPR